MYSLVKKELKTLYPQCRLKYSVSFGFSMKMLDAIHAGRKEMMVPLMSSKSTESKPRGATKNS
jgi:hypothetical protein